jgi:hypothetical protein
LQEGMIIGFCSNAKQVVLEYSKAKHCICTGSELPIKQSIGGIL